MFLKLLGDHVEYKPGKEKTYLFTMTANLKNSFVVINIMPFDYDGNPNNYTDNDIKDIADSFYFDKM